jgi:ABC-type sugar transport system permease subunit
MKRKLGKDRKEEITAYLLLSPIFAMLLFFMYYPPLLGMFRSLFRWQIGKTAEYIGIANYIKYFQSPYTMKEIGNMFTLLGAGIFTGVAFPLFMALLLNGLRSNSASSLYRRMIMVPMVAPGMVVIMIWKYLYDPALGPINSLLEWLRLDALAMNWLGDYKTVLGAVIFVGFPWVAQLGTFIFLGGILQLPTSFFEAARIEGARSGRITFTITIPLLARQFRLQMTLVAVAALTAFNGIMVMTDGGPGFSSMVPGLSMYKRAFIYNEFGMSSAIGVMIFLVALAMTFLIARLTKRGEDTQ